MTKIKFDDATIKAARKALLVPEGFALAAQALRVEVGDE